MEKNTVRKIQIITDTSSDIPQEVAKELNISIIPLVVSCGGVEYLDKIDITADEVYERTLKGEYFTTSQCTYGQLYERFEKFAKEGTDMIYLSVSSNLSGGYQSALMAKEQVNEIYPDVRIGVIDSFGGSMGLGWLALRAARMNERGCGFDEIMETVEKAKGNIHYYITVDNFDCLTRGGRVPKGVGKFADVLGIKPIITVIDGRLALTPKGSAQRGMKKCMRKILDFISEEAKIDENTLVAFAHAYDMEKSETFSAMFEERFGRGADMYPQIGTSIAVHGGPTAFAVFVDDFDSVNK